jgi:small nuclear ribonucleoprotein (snRNP)-like protein
MLGLINWRLKVTINDGRAFIGQMLAFDRHMNLVLADCEEFRRVRLKKKPGETEAGPEQEMKRSLGLVILRGETVVSLSVEGPPPVQDDDKKSAVCATLLRVPNCRNPKISIVSLFSCIYSFLQALVAGCRPVVEWEWSLPVRVVVLP